MFDLFNDDVSGSGCLINNEMGNNENVETVTSRCTRRIKENHENIKLVGIRAKS